ncbi:PqqD family protein [Sphingopyxis sp. BSNA05]|uniref:PqqD family protein n=1 Tax=Sphingopyxis sp. BSNA05 TaxID=1236614 RepID=UPI00156364F3|nr:PqqD family protein [Sphingopyxis sp. BSNA05]NRD90034.1 PqqD family protein [Sphingopyxis sp. BSNA05]
MLLVQNIKINPDVIYQEVEGEVVLLNTESEKYFGLDYVGAKFWAIASETGNVNEIITRMYDIFDVERDRLTNDINILIKK